MNNLRIAACGAQNAREAGPGKSPIRSGRRLAVRTALSFLAAALVFQAIGCAFGWNLRKDPLFDAFLEKTSLIMTEEEIDIYMHLPDVSSKQEFIAGFWKMRDPDPTTEVSEGKLEFERRVDFANRWFNPFGSCSGRPVAHSTSKPLGWDSNRGRHYIVMGPPDRIMLGAAGLNETAEEDRGDLLCRASAWYYERYKSSVYFGSWGMSKYAEKTVLPDDENFTEPLFSSVGVNTETMNRAKLDWLSWEFRGWTAKPFVFKVRCRREGVSIRIPIDRLSFEALDGRLRGRLKTEIHIYQAGMRKEVLRDERNLDYDEKEILDLQAVEYVVPFQPKTGGSHLFDVIVAFEAGSAKAQYRNYAKKRY